MKHAVILDEVAARDLKDHLSHLASVSPGAERALWEDFAHLVELLSDFPELHQEYERRLRRAELSLRGRVGEPCRVPVGQLGGTPEARTPLT